jgi:sugar phosphate isomerase/epimerase
MSGLDFRPSRRALLAGSAATVAIGALSGCTTIKNVYGSVFKSDVSASPAPMTTAKTGIQLYTIRSEMAKDVPGSLKKLADIGYQELEFAGYFGHSPDEIKKMVADLGMTAPSSHMQRYPDLPPGPQAMIDDALTAGHEWLVWAWFPPEERTPIEKWKQHADLFNSFGARCAKAGLKFAYHNHNFEFDMVDGQRPYDVLMANTDPAVVHFELDMYWCEKGGANILETMKKYADRIAMVHVKDMLPNGDMTDVSLGTIPFADIFATPGTAKIAHYFVENDDTKTPFESAAISQKALSKILAGLG